MSKDHVESVILGHLVKRVCQVHKVQRGLQACLVSKVQWVPKDLEGSPAHLD